VADGGGHGHVRPRLRGAHDVLAVAAPDARGGRCAGPRVPGDDDVCGESVADARAVADVRPAVRDADSVHIFAA
jgi:hypothetical protein